MKRKFFSVLLAGLFTLSVAACGSDSVSESQDDNIGESVTASENLDSTEDTKPEVEETEPSEDLIKYEIETKLTGVKAFVEVNNEEYSAFYLDGDDNWFYMSDMDSEPILLDDLNPSAIYKLGGPCSQKGFYAYREKESGLIGIFNVDDLSVSVEPVYTDAYWFDGSFLGVVFEEQEAVQLDYYEEDFLSEAEDLTYLIGDFYECNCINMFDGVIEIMAQNADGAKFTRVYDIESKNALTLNSTGSNYIYGNEYFVYPGNLYMETETEQFFGYKMDNSRVTIPVEDDIYLIPNSCAVGSDGWLSCSKFVLDEESGSYVRYDEVFPDESLGCFYNILTGDRVDSIVESSSCAYRPTNSNPYTVTKDDNIAFLKVQQSDESYITYPYDLIEGEILAADGFIYIDDSFYIEDYGGMAHKLVQLPNENYAYVNEVYAIVDGSTEYEDATNFSSVYFSGFSPVEVPIIAVVRENGLYHVIDEQFNVVSEDYEIDGNGVAMLGRSGSFLKITHPDSDVFDVAIVREVA